MSKPRAAERARYKNAVRRYMAEPTNWFTCETNTLEQAHTLASAGDFLSVHPSDDFDGLPTIYRLEPSGNLRAVFTPKGDENSGDES